MSMCVCGHPGTDHDAEWGCEADCADPVNRCWCVQFSVLGEVYA